MMKNVTYTTPTNFVNTLVINHNLDDKTQILFPEKSKSKLR